MPIGNLLLNLLISEKGKIQSVDHFPSETPIWVWCCIYSKAGTRVYASCLLLDFGFTCHKVSILNLAKQDFLIKLKSVWSWNYHSLLVIVIFYCFKSFIQFGFIIYDLWSVLKKVCTTKEADVSWQKWTNMKSYTTILRFSILWVLY